MSVHCCGVGLAGSRLSHPEPSRAVPSCPELLLHVPEAAELIQPWLWVGLMQAVALGRAQR